MIRLVYVSQSKCLDLDEVQGVLNVSFEKNEILNITGALIYTKGYFIQCIEGEDETIEAVYQRILKDSRHENIVTISKESIDTRVFEGWNMSLVNEKGYKSILQKYCQDEDCNFYFMQPNAVLNMLKEVSLVM